MIMGPKRSFFETHDLLARAVIQCSYDLLSSGNRLPGVERIKYFTTIFFQYKMFNSSTSVFELRAVNKWSLLEPSML